MDRLHGPHTGLRVSYYIASSLQVEGETVNMAKIELSDLNSCLFNARELSSEELAALKASIRHFSHTLEGWQQEVGYRLATTITVNRQGSRIVGGHQRVKALLSLGQTWIHSDDITWVDMKPDGAEEKALNLTLNNPHNQGDFTSEALPLIEELQGGFPDHTADLDLDGLLDDLRTTLLGARHSGAPFVEKEIPEAWQVLVECADEQQQRKVYDQMSKEGYRCRVLTL